jgi:hypothetical protein
MAQKKIVHVVGTGTIGEPLIGILSTFRGQFGIDEVTFHKRTPLLTDHSKVIVLCQKGAKLSVDKDRWQNFMNMGMTPSLEAEEAIERAHVIIDARRSAMRTKKSFTINTPIMAVGLLPKAVNTASARCTRAGLTTKRWSAAKIISFRS